MKWYLAVRPWSDSGHNVVRHSNGKLFPYFGISGDAWPLDDVKEAAKVHKMIRDSRSYVASPNGTDPFVCQERTAAEEYFDIATRHFKFVRLLEIDFEFNDTYDGIDFGDPEGGYSVINSELVQIDDGSQLNQYGLFADLQQIELYTARRKSHPIAETLEELDGYNKVAVRIIRHQ